MSGTKGRSGGHNRKTASEHRVAGTFRRDRHGARPMLPEAAAARLNDLRTVYASTLARHQWLLERYDSAMSSNAAVGPTLRELRQHADLLVRLGTALDRLERDAADAAASNPTAAEFNPVTEFLNRYSRRKAHSACRPDKHTEGFR